MIPNHGPLPTSEVEACWWRDLEYELSWVETDEFCAVFDSATGETHLLNPLPALLLRHIDQEPRNILQLLESVSGGDVFTADSIEAQKAFVALKSLHLAELVESTVSRPD